MSTGQAEPEHSPSAYLRLAATCFPDWSAPTVAWQAAQTFLADFPDCGYTAEQLAAAMLADTGQ